MVSSKSTVSSYSLGEATKKGGAFLRALFFGGGGASSRCVQTYFKAPLSFKKEEDMPLLSPARSDLRRKVVAAWHCTFSRVCKGDVMGL